MKALTGQARGSQWRTRRGVRSRQGVAEQDGRGGERRHRGARKGITRGNEARDWIASPNR